jgi:hypothetical protein
LALQERAKRAKTPAELSAIIDEMNALLGEYEEAAGDGHHFTHGDGRRPQGKPAKGKPKKTKS